MPHKNTIRSYLRGGYYHIYNRGVEKRNIFEDDLDYQTFLGLIEYYLAPSPPLKHHKRLPYWRSKLDENEVEILCFCLMPNHFHLLTKQNTPNGLTRFMRRIFNAYVRYFNKKHTRVGGLFQGKFKAALIETDPYLLHLSRYIHLNPLEVGPLKDLSAYPYSSYLNYLRPKNGNNKNNWIESQTILAHFQNQEQDFTSYQSFVETYKIKPPVFLGDLTLD